MEMASHDSQLYRIRHSLAHVLAQAVKLEYPSAALGFGPPTDTGFYYDFDFGDTKISDEALKVLESRMKKIIGQRQPFTFEDSTRAEALAACQKLGENYKIENIENLHSRGVSNFRFYTNGPFQDLCEGPHVNHTGELPAKSFKLDRIAGAYWLGDEKNKMLTRIYALAYETPEELDNYLKRRALALEYDHKKIGKEQELFHFDDLVGKGLPLWLPNGTVLRQEIENYAEEVEFNYGYKRVHTPCIAKEDLFKTSQHLPAYVESMFPPMVVTNEQTGYVEKFYLRPMNCPHHHLIFSMRKRSYRELPMRLAEYGQAFRFEQSGELSGLIRVRTMAINDAHIYCRKDQLRAEILHTLKLYDEVYSTFKLSNFKYRLSVRSRGEGSEKFKGTDEMWNESEAALKEILEQLNIPYYVGEGEAAFYGPKIDIQFRNLLGREETVSTIQVDFLAAVNFNLRYTGEDGKEESPVVIHRAPLSTHERFISFLIEYYGGAFPLWMNPLQVVLIPVNETCLDYCLTLKSELHGAKVRVEVDESHESFNKKIRINTMKKASILLIIGNKEVDSNMVTVRRYGVTEQETLSKDEFISGLLKDIKTRVNNREPVTAML
jgi:threonyl-tRNA synthetase